MNKNLYFALWGGLFILCAVLGFIPEPQGAGKWLMVILAVGFFVPPAILAWQARKEGDRMLLRLLRNLSAGSLGLTVAVLIGNFLTVMAPVAVGDAMYAILVIVSSPMICGQYWLLSLFLWAMLLVYTVSGLMGSKEHK